MCVCVLVVTSLVLNGETLDEVSLAGRCRTSAVRMLCRMHPAKSAYVQALAISHCKHPTLVLSLALEAEENRMRSVTVGMRYQDDWLGVAYLGLVCLRRTPQNGIFGGKRGQELNGSKRTKSQYLTCKLSIPRGGYPLCLNMW